jgi:xylan 1,4-beta-xylosidase
MSKARSPFITALLAVAMLCANQGHAQSDSGDRVISADYGEIKGPKSTVYQRCVGAGRLAEGLRADWQQQLLACRQAIGFQYLRCHGLLQDELGVYSEDGKGNPDYNWQYIDMVYDYLLSIGVRPFVEIGFMPQALASVKSDPAAAPPGTKLSPSTFWWRANVTAPKSWERWDDLVTALVRHWTARYGADEVRQWYFEIWNEPNYPYFFHPVNEATRRDEYFTLYRNTARAVKTVDPAYRVGGPAAAGAEWVPELIDFCAKGNVPLDFISFHSYGLGTGPAGKDANGQDLHYLNRNLDIVASQAHSEDAAIRSSAMPKLPVEITEWSASYSNFDPIHDTYFEAPYILEQLKNTETLGSMSYWTFTDIFEEGGPPKTPFEGGFGLINLQGIKKSAFFAYQFLNQLGDTELKDSDGQSWVCRDKSGGLQVLLYNLTDPRPAGAPVPDWSFFRKVHVPSPAPSATIHISSVPTGSYHLTVCRIGYQENDAYSAYLKMGAPRQLTPAQVKQLKSLATGAAVEEEDTRIDESNLWERTIPMRQNEVVLVTLKKI